MPASNVIAPANILLPRWVRIAINLQTHRPHARPPATQQRHVGTPHPHDASTSTKYSVAQTRKPEHISASVNRTQHTRPASSRTVELPDTVKSTCKSMGENKERSGRYTTHSQRTITNGSTAAAAPQQQHTPRRRWNQHKDKKSTTP
ncbi:hypothetical protein TcCL_NonESM05869 [Trypanosoma cruzi]|nr:hypothetical protein TcCL_NonESM05869 [Trypanosoma cruzi]